MRKKKKPETLSNSRDKRTVGQQTKRPAEVTREGPTRPLGGTRLTKPAGRGGGSPAAPGPLSRLLGAPHFTPRRPRPRLCGREYPRRPDRTCSFLTAPSLPRGRPPLQEPTRPAAEPGPIFGLGVHSWRLLPEPGRSEGRAGGLQMGLRGAPGAMGTSGFLERIPARRRGSRSRERSRGLGGRAREQFLGTGRRVAERSQSGVSACRGRGWLCELGASARPERQSPAATKPRGSRCAGKASRPRETTK